MRPTLVRVAPPPPPPPHTPSFLFPRLPAVSTLIDMLNVRCLVFCVAGPPSITRKTSPSRQHDIMGASHPHMLLWDFAGNVVLGH